VHVLGGELDLAPLLWSGSGAAQPLDLPPGDPTEVALSPDARYVLYSAPFPDMTDVPQNVRLLDRTTGRNYVVSVDRYGNSIDAPDVDSAQGAFSGDGTQLAFTSIANNIVPDDTNPGSDVFERPLTDVLGGGSGGTQRVSN
jgi:hypothetical protein